MLDIWRIATFRQQLALIFLMVYENTHFMDERQLMMDDGCLPQDISSADTELKCHGSKLF